MAWVDGPAGVVERAQGGDPEAFRVLYRDIQPRLLRYLHALAGQDAEDIASETWLQPTRDLPAEDLAAWPAADDTAQGALDAVATGHVLGKRAGAIRTAAHRGLKTLRKNWGPTSPSSQIATSIATS